MYLAEGPKNKDSLLRQTNEEDLREIKTKWSLTHVWSWKRKSKYIPSEVLLDKSLLLSLQTKFPLAPSTFPTTGSTEEIIEVEIVAFCCFLKNIPSAKLWRLWKSRNSIINWCQNTSDNQICCISIIIFLQTSSRRSSSQHPKGELKTSNSSSFPPSEHKALGISKVPRGTKLKSSNSSSKPPSDWLTCFSLVSEKTLEKNGLELFSFCL